MLVRCILNEIAETGTSEEEKSEAARKLRSAADLLEIAGVSDGPGGGKRKERRAAGKIVG
jgi:hypothetical protein